MVSQNSSNIIILKTTPIEYNPIIYILIFIERLNEKLWMHTCSYQHHHNIISFTNIIFYQFHLCPRSSHHRYY